MVVANFLSLGFKVIIFFYLNNILEPDLRVYAKYLKRIAVHYNRVFLQI